MQHLKTNPASFRAERGGDGQHTYLIAKLAATSLPPTLLWTQTLYVGFSSRIQYEVDDIADHPWTPKRSSGGLLFLHVFVSNKKSFLAAYYYIASH